MPVPLLLAIRRHLAALRMLLVITVITGIAYPLLISGIAQAATHEQTVRVSSAFIQPIWSDDVAAALADVALEAPKNDTIEVAGPDRIHIDDLIRRFLSATKDPREVITDVNARYYGAVLSEHSLTAGENARISPTHFEEWLNNSVAQK